MNEDGKVYHTICKRPDGSTDVKGHWNHVSLKQSMAGEPIEVARQEVSDLVSRSLGLIVFSGSLDVKFLDLDLLSHCIIDVQKHYTTRYHNVSVADKTLPPLENGAQYKLTLSLSD